MYVILVYDIGEKRVVKMLKLCRRYLNWIQNSVFEGEITEVKLKELKYEAKTIMKDVGGGENHISMAKLLKCLKLLRSWGLVFLILNRIDVNASGKRPELTVQA